MGRPRTSRVSVTVDIEAPPVRVWQALTFAYEVSQWDGVLPLHVPDDYPAVGQHARWRTRIGPVHAVLHDRVRVVEPGRCLASTIDVGFIHVEEEYSLSETAIGTRLVSDNEVSSHLPGLTGLARRLTTSNVNASMVRLKAFCESSGAWVGHANA